MALVLFEYQYAVRVSSSASSTVTFRAGVILISVLSFTGVSPVIIGALFADAVVNNSVSALAST